MTIIVMEICLRLVRPVTYKVLLVPPSKLGFSANSNVRHNHRHATHTVS